MEHYHETEATNKYNDALALYTTALSDEEVKAKTARIIEKFVDENPEAVAQLLRNWINEDWG